MMEEGDDDLKDLRDALKTTIPDVETLIFVISKGLQSLSIHPTSVPPLRNNPTTFKSIARYLPSIQIQLLDMIIPNFLHVLDPSHINLLTSFFVPPKNNDPNILKINRSISLISYLTLPDLLSSSSKKAVYLPAGSREFVLTILESLVKTYSIDDLYWAVWTSNSNEGTSRDANIRMLKWEDSVKAVIGVPTKSANAVGRWKQDGWSGELPQGMIPRSYYDRLLSRFEELLYEVSQSSTIPDLSPLRLVVEKLAAQGLLQAPPSSQTSPQPLFFTPLLPSLLTHLHPPTSSPLRPYPPGFLPSLFLPLPQSQLAAYVSSLLQHLTFFLPLIPPGGSLLPDRPDTRVKIAIDVLQGVIGSAVVGGEAWEAVLRCVLDGKMVGEVMEDRGHARVRVVVGWVALGGEKVIKTFLDAMMEAWTDPKHVKYALYAKQFYMTHIMLLSLSLLPIYHPFLIALSHRPRFLLSLQSYLSHPDPKIRRLGMLVAEIMSQVTMEEDSEGSRNADPDDDVADLQAGLEVDEDSGESKRKRKGAASKVKRLKFGDRMWSGDGEGREESRWLRQANGTRDEDSIIPDGEEGGWLLGWDRATSSPELSEHVDLTIPTGRGRHTKKRPALTPPPQPHHKPKIIVLDPEQEQDPLTGYDLPSPSSSRSASPTPSYLEEVAADPTLALDGTQKKKVTRPVYVGQLVELLKERDKPDHLEMGLKWGEGLVRAKRNFGVELAENSVALAAMIIALNDAFNLDDFDEKRQSLLTALVACSPKTVAPYLAEQYFGGHYSLQQRSVILTSLAMGARELAGLTVPSSQNSSRKIDFPTKTLPPQLHKKYISPQDQHPDLIEDAVSGVRSMLISKGARKGEETVPELAREKRLRLGGSSKKTPLIAEVGSLNEHRQMVDRATTQTQRPVIPFKDIACECFIMPLINRFWQYYQDTSTREDRSLKSSNRYRGAGTGMILSPMALEKFLMTLSLLVHAARHSSTFLSILSPESLELGLTIGSRQSLQPLDNPSGPGAMDGNEFESASQPEAQVIGAALELCLVSLDGAVDLDQGKTLIMDKPSLVLGVGEWAMKVFDRENSGERAAGSGGEREGRTRAAAAGVVVKVFEITEKFSGGLGAVIR